jgi:hypothetical protein
MNIIETLTDRANAFQAAADKEAQHAFITSTPYAVVNGSMTQAVFCDKDAYAPVEIKSNLCGFHTFSRDAAEKVATFCGERHAAAGWHVALVRDLPQLIADDARKMLALMQA